MIKLITGKRGTGKTKILIDAIHEAENKSNGNVVAIQKGSSLNTDITPDRKSTRLNSSHP